MDNLLVTVLGAVEVVLVEFSGVTDMSVVALSGSGIWESVVSTITGSEVGGFFLVKKKTPPTKINIAGSRRSNVFFIFVY